jgi:hypothetical protein
LNLRSFQMESSTVMACTPERAWAVFSAVPRWPGWSPVCLRVWGETGKPLSVGARFGFKLRMGALKPSFNVTVVESDPPRRAAWASTKFTVTARRTFDFTPVAGGTRVTDRKDFSSIALPIGLWYPRRLVRAMTEKWLLDLKGEAERTP